MSSFFAAYWIVWAVLLAYLVRLGRHQRRLARQIATVSAVLEQRQHGRDEAFRKVA